MQMLLTAIVTWLSINFGLPAIYEHPRVEFASAAKMAEVRYGRLASIRPDRVAAEAGHSAPPEFGHGVQAIYDDRSRTIYLPEGWTGATPAEVSVLVHELVHHLQNIAELKYDCSGAREKPAYRAQARWLEVFGKNLVDEFELDAMTILMRTSCMH
ncbi:MAG: hypothetical protein Q8P46_01135 [Hyphomicrobiales bacterium]|nr:hypothetical protein [Hyphomicrobiales bacterium]